ncbi:MAG: CCA tRNA nucleotidyltransferase [Acidimicrobiales bacterium]
MTDTRDEALAEVAPLAQRFEEGGHRLYLVGGIVRDLYLGVDLDALDFDLTTDARPARIRELVEPIASVLWTQGERFGTIGCRIDGRDYEITTHRAEYYPDGDSRNPTVEFGDDIHGDLSRRDFTVNAMAIDLDDGALVDPFGGRAALDAHILDTPIDPSISFRDDPLRILRAARFVARHGLQPQARVTEAASALVDRLDIVSTERIRDEFDKLLLAERPGSGIRFLFDIGALSRTLGPLDRAEASKLADDLDRCDRDVGVRRTVALDPLGAHAATDRARQLRLSNSDIRFIDALLAGLDTIRAHVGDWTDADIRRLVLRVGDDRIDALAEVAAARGVDASGFSTRHQELGAEEDLGALTPALTGEAVMRALGLDPGPEVGATLSRLLERRLDNGPATEAEELDWLAANPPA